MKIADDMRCTYKEIKRCIGAYNDKRYSDILQCFYYVITLVDLTYCISLNEIIFEKEMQLINAVCSVDFVNLKWLILYTGIPVYLV